MFLHSVNLWNLAFYVFMVLLATLGLWDVFFGFEENKCSMSYMFEYPEYQVRPALPPSLTCALARGLLRGSAPNDDPSRVAQPSGHLKPVSCLVLGRASCRRRRRRGPFAPHSWAPRSRTPTSDPLGTACLIPRELQPRFPSPNPVLLRPSFACKEMDSLRAQ